MITSEQLKDVMERTDALARYLCIDQKKVEFEEEMDNTSSNIKKLVGFVSAFCEKDQTLPFDPSGVAAVVEYASSEGRPYGLCDEN